MTEKLTPPTSGYRSVEQAAGSPSADSDSALSEALRFGAILRRRLFPTVAIFAAVTVAVALLGLTRTRLYRTKATLHVADSTPNVLQGVGDVYSLGTLNPYEFPRYMETQAKILRSREITSEVIVKLRLDEDMEFLGLEEGLEGVDLQEQLALMDPVLLFQDKVSVEQVENSNLLRIVCVDTHAVRAALVVNTLADTFIEYNSGQREDATESAVTWLKLQVEEAEQNVRAAEARLLEFRENQVLMGASIEDAIAINAATIEDLNRAATEVRLERMSKRARWEQVAGGSSEHLDTIPEIVADPVVQEIRKELMEIERERADLEARYGEKHPAMADLDQPEQDLEALLEREVDQIIGAERRGIRALGIEESAVKSSIEEEQDRAEALSRLQIEYDHLVREMEQQRDLAEMLQLRFQEASLAEQLSTNNVSVIEYSPTPLHPYKPRLPFVALTALMIGLIFAVTGSLLLDRVDAKIRTHTQLEDEFGLRVLGHQLAVAEPGKPGKDGKKTPPVEFYAACRPRSPFAECLRTLRTNLLFATSKGTYKTILVTSSFSGEGKTTFAANLAQTLAASGQQTLLLDGDLRKPGIGGVLGAGEEQGQLSRLLVGEVELDDAVSGTDIENLHVLLCGPPPSSPAELLGSQQFVDLLQRLAEKYDQVVIDSSPVLPVTDAKILSQLVDLVLVVVREDVSDRYALRQCLRQLRDVGAPILGTVFNGADLHKSPYGRQYGYGYGYGEKPKKK